MHTRIGVFALVLLALIGLCPQARGQGTRKDDIVLGPGGRPVSAARVAVCLQPATTSTAPCSPLANIYQDIALTVPMTNPLTADGLGNYYFYAAPGLYTIQIYGSGLSARVFPDVLLPIGTQANVALVPQASAGICYAAPWGNDTFTGLSWGSAKFTIMACYDQVVAGSNMGGTVYYTSGTTANAVAGAGIWICGNSDAACFANPPAGWHKQKNAAPVSFVGLAGTVQGSNSNFAGRADLLCGDSSSAVKPCAWFSGTDVNYHIANTVLRHGKRAVLIGVCADNTTVLCSSAAITFWNDFFGVPDIAGNGPTVKISGNSGLWINFYYCGWQGTGDTNAAISDEANGLLIDGRTSAGANLIYIYHGNTQLGGIRFYPGSSSGGIFVDTLTCETLNGGACVHIAGNGSATSHLKDVNIADYALGVNVYNIQVDPSVPPGLVEASGSYSGGLQDNGSGTFRGNLGPMNSSGFAFSPLTNSPVRNSAGGIVGGSQVLMLPRVLGRVDDVRSSGAPVAVPYANIAKQKPADWVSDGASVIVGSKAFTRDGTTNAGEVTAPSAAQVYFMDANLTLTAGEIIPMGVWYRSTTGNGYSGGAPVGFLAVGGCATFTDISGLGTPAIGASLKSFINGDGEWNWLYRVYKVTSSVSNPCEFRFYGSVDATHTARFAYPVVYQIPTGTISDNEAAELGMMLTTPPDNANRAGDITFPRGHDFMLQQHLTQAASRNDIAGICTLGTSCAITFTTAYQSTPVCVGTDQTAAAAVKSAPSTSGVTFTGTGVDVIAYACFGAPN